MKTYGKVLIAAFLVVAGLTGVALADQTRGMQWPEAFFRMNGQPLHRATMTPSDAAAEDNTTASGGAAVVYTFRGGERVCIQTAEAAWIQIIAAASQTAALSFKVAADQPLSANCVTLALGQTKVSCLCVSGNCSACKLFEMQ